MGFGASSNKSAPRRREQDAHGEGSVDDAPRGWRVDRDIFHHGLYNESQAPGGGEPMGSRGWAHAVAAVVCVWAAAGPALAGPWTLPEGRGIAIATLFGSQADQRFDGAGALGATPRFRKAEIQVLAEYGITDRFTLRGRTEARALRFEDRPSANDTGLGFTEVGVRARLLQRGSLVLSAEGNLRGAEARAVEGPEATGGFRFEAEARGLAGYGFQLRGRDAFAAGELAYRFRASRPDELRLDLTLGVRPVPRTLLLAQVFSAFGIMGEDGVPAGSDHKLQLSAVRDVTPAMSVQFGGFATLAARDRLAERGLLLAVWRRF
jgi:protein XagA